IDDVNDLLERRSAARERLSNASRSSAITVSGIEFVTRSGLFDFTECPHRFYYRHVLGAAGDTADVLNDTADPQNRAGRRRSTREELDARTLGVLLHDFLCASMSTGGGNDRPKGNGLDEFAKRYGLTRTQHKKAVQRAKKRLDAFAKTPLAKPAGELWAERPVRARLDRLVFRAVIDRMDSTESGYRIIDYKLETERERYAYQVQFYTWMLRTLGRQTVCESLLCYLQVPTKIVPVDISPEKIEAIDHDARDLEAAVSSGRFDPRPGDVCNECVFNRMCLSAK
ncbi:MAG: PD-(D/E)XK nuclease family protein, partial [Candidatus Latescibacterota bacterium]